MTDTTKYEVSGTQLPKDAIVEENFAIEVNARSSREAYIRIINRTGYQHINVIAIKMECPTCAGFHLIVPTNLYK